MTFLELKRKILKKHFTREDTEQPAGTQKFSPKKNCCKFIKDVLQHSALTGGYAMLSLIQTQVVVAHEWISESAFTDIVAISLMIFDQHFYYRFSFILVYKYQHINWASLVLLSFIASCFKPRKSGHQKFIFKWIKCSPRSDL